MKRIISICVFIALCMQGLQAEELSLYGVLKHSYSVRTQGMGNAFVSVADGESSVISNPAGLAYPGASYSYQDLDYDGMFSDKYRAQYFYNSPLGFASMVHEDRSGNRLKMNVLGHGRLGRNGVSWGLSYKDISGTLNGETVDGWSSDFGLLFRLYPWLGLGVTIKDIYVKDLDINTTFSVGMAGYHKKETLMWNLEAVFDNDVERLISTRAGGEYVLADSLTLRGGISNSTLYSGARFRALFLTMDFAVKNDILLSEGSQYSLAFNIGRGSAASQYRKRYALFKKSSYAEFSIGSSIKHGKSEVSMLGGYKIGSNDLLSLIHLANQDPSCEGYIIRVGNLSTSLTSIGLVEEIRGELKKAKAKGKKIFVYFEGAVGLPEYYLGSLATVIVMPPLGNLGQFGLDIETQKAETFLERLGIKKHTITSGAHKASTGMFSEELKEADKIQLKELIESVFAQVVAEIQEERADTESGLLQISDGRFITAAEAKSLGLVDQLAYWPEMDSIVKTYDKNLHKIDIAAFVPHKTPSVLRYLNRIAVLEIDGSITMGNNGTNFLFGGSSTGAEEFDKVVDSVKSDYSIRGVILRVNSPGGSVLAADRMYTAIERLKASGKLVYTSMGSVATSGGYYVATNSDQIYANKSSLTGSIGVISSMTSFAILQDELGVKRDVIKTGKYMDIYSRFKTLTREEKQLLQQHQDNYYQEFVRKVQQDRQFSDSEVYTVAQGQLFSGKQAKRYKMIDKEGNLFDAIGDMADTLDIQNPDVVFIRSRSKFSFPFVESRVASRAALLFNWLTHR